jgi:16S rRNA (guanine527-N7)-methyltransferase
MGNDWHELAARAGVELTAERERLLERYLELLLAANRVMNLTRITGADEARSLHVGDALTLLPFLPPGPHVLADLGSGGGVPGIPLAIVRPEARVCLIESVRKKADFLRQTAAELGLGNVTVLHGRGEAVGDPWRGRFDIVTARAVGTLDRLAAWVAGLLRPSGRWLAMKGPQAELELAAAGEVLEGCGFAPAAIHPAGLPQAQGHVIVELVLRQRPKSCAPNARLCEPGGPAP